MENRVKLCLFLLLMATLKNAQASGRADTCKNKDTACVAEAFGFSPSCVVSTLSICEETSFDYAIKRDLQNLVDSLNRNSQSGTSASRSKSSRNRHCGDLKTQGDSSGIRTIYPYDSMPRKPVKALCEQNTDRGGWTIIQRRSNFRVRENFERTWVEYVLGFGDLEGEFWLGLENIHALTTNQLMELRLDFEDWDDQKRFAKYRYFFIGNSTTNYRLSVGGYTGDAGDSLVGEFVGFNHDGMMFSTFDNDNDLDNKTDASCAQRHKGAWWYNSCHISNLNAKPLVGNAAQQGDGISWHTWQGTYYSMKKARMMVRPSNF